MRISDWSSDVCSSDLRGPSDRLQRKQQQICSSFKAPIAIHRFEAFRPSRALRINVRVRNVNSFSRERKVSLQVRNAVAVPYWLRMKPGICRRAIYAGAKLKAGPDPSSMPIKNRPEPAAPSTRAQALLSLGERRDGLGAGQIGAGLTAGKRSSGPLTNEQGKIGRAERREGTGTNGALPGGAGTV